MLNRGRQAGFSLLEIAIAVAILSIILLLGAPAYREWVANNKIRVAAESVQNGLQLTRAEAIRRNASVRFQLVDVMTSACKLGASSNWVVSLEDPTGKCDQAPSTTSPKIIQKQLAAEGSDTVTVTPGTASTHTVTFNGFGRTVANSDGSATATQFDFSVASSLNANPRTFRLTIGSPGGEIALCDPKVTDTTDPRYCN